MEMSDKGRNLFLRTAVFALAALLALPALALADPKQKRGRGRGKPTEVFVNGHDARDGRRDNKGHKHKNRDRDRYDDDDYYNGRRPRDDRYGDRAELRNRALSYGYREGYEEGREDRRNGEGYEFRDEGEYRDASAGYRDQYGDFGLYQRYFREGFERGYRDGYENRASQRGGGLGDILGGIFGRP